MLLNSNANWAGGTSLTALEKLLVSAASFLSSIAPSVGLVNIYNGLSLCDISKLQGAIETLYIIERRGIIFGVHPLGRLLCRMVSICFSHRPVLLRCLSSLSGFRPEI